MKKKEPFCFGDIVEWDENGPFKSKLPREKEKYGSGPFEVIEVVPFGLSALYRIKKTISSPSVQSELLSHQWFKKVE